MAEFNSVECNSYEARNIYPNLSATPSNEQQFRLNKINKTKDYFVAEIKERELKSKRLFLDYFDKSLVFLSLTTGSISFASFATVVVALVGMMSASCSLAFSGTTGIVKKLLKALRNKKKKQKNCCASYK